MPPIMLINIIIEEPLPRSSFVINSANHIESIEPVVNDKIIFELLTGAQAAKAKVSEVEGVNVTNVSIASSTVSELEIIPFDASGKYVAISTSPHGFVNKDLVSLAGFNTSINSLEGGFNIKPFCKSVSILSRAKIGPNKGNKIKTC